MESIINLIEIAENNLRAAKTMLVQLSPNTTIRQAGTPTPGPRSNDEGDALEVTEGHFDGESMVGDNGQVYIVPPNYASKTQLVVGDRMKWILTPTREVFKLINQVPRERVIGTFSIEGDDYYVLVNQYPHPIKILKASATYAMKNLGLTVGDEVAIIVPRDTTPTWGAFSTVVKSGTEQRPETKPVESSVDELHNMDNLNLDLDIESSNDYF